MPGYDFLEILLANPEDAVISSEPKPATTVGYDLRYKIVIQPIFRIELNVASVLKATRTPAGITDPHETIRGSI